MAVDPRMYAKTEDALKKMQLRSYCQTCGMLFLEISGTEYVKNSKHLVLVTPDRWFIETGIHWAENFGHLIILEFLNEEGKVIHSQNLSQVWDKKLKGDQMRNPAATRELQRIHFYKYREECKDNPI